MEHRNGCSWPDLLRRGQQSVCFCVACSNAHAYRNAFSYSYRYCHGHSDVNAYCHCNGYFNTHGNGYTDRDFHSHFHPNYDSTTNPDIYTYSYFD